MELIGYSTKEEAAIICIGLITDPVAKEAAQKEFEKKTGKQFPEVSDWQPNIDVMRASAAARRGEVDPY